MPRPAKELFGLLFNPSCTTLWNWHVHPLCQFRFGVSKNSFAGTGVLRQMLFAWSKSRKLVYLHDALWKDRSYFQLTTHRPNERAKRTDIHIGPLFHLRDRRLRDLQKRGQMRLRDISCRPQLLQRHFCHHLLRCCPICIPAFRRHRCPSGFPFLGHNPSA
jgi:hypothetical protein